MWVYLTLIVTFSTRFRWKKNDLCKAYLVNNFADNHGGIFPNTLEIRILLFLFLQFSSHAKEYSKEIAPHNSIISRTWMVAFSELHLLSISIYASRFYSPRFYHRMRNWRLGQRFARKVRGRRLFWWVDRLFWIQ